MARFLGEPHTTLDQTHERIERLMRFEREHGFTLWPIVERSSGMVIGDCGLIPLERVGPEIELGYRLGSAHWGKGYATEAALTVRDLGFERFGLDQIYVDVDPENHGSLNVARKLGARLLGPAMHLGDPVQRFVLEPAST